MVKKESNNEDVKYKIINAAIREFAQYGYKAASTNNICKDAKVSKGLIYYYFKSKEEIYLSAFRYVLDKFKENVAICIDDTQKNGIDYISEYFDTKFKFMRENPLDSKFIVNSILFYNMPRAIELYEEFQSYNNNLIYEVIKNIDINPKFNREKAFELIIMIGEKLEEKHMRNIENKNSDDIIQDFRKDHRIMIEMVFEGIDK